jgi:hypothetical protein
MTLVGVRTEVENYDCSGQVNLATSLASIANCHSAALGVRR